MPDDPNKPLPVFPNENDVKVTSDFINLQKQLEEIFIKQRDTVNDIRHINADLQAKMKSRFDAEKAYINDTLIAQDKLTKLYDQEAFAIVKNGAEFKKNIASLQEQITFNKKQISMLEEMNDFEAAVAKRKFNDQHVYSTVISDFFKKYFNFQNAEIEHIHNATAALKEQHPALWQNRNLISAIALAIIEAVKLFKEFDKSAWEFRKTMGFVKDQVNDVRSLSQNISLDFMNIGVNTNIVNESIIALSKSMGGVHNVSRQIVETVSILNAQLGTSIDESTKMLRNFAALSGTTMNAQTSMVYFTQALSGAAGVSFNQVVSDFKNMRDISLMMISRLPSAMAKTAVELRRMGTDLNTSATASSRLLDFTQNIQDEMAAAVLLGHSINLQKARELAYNRDLVGSSNEILRLAKLNNFAHGMDYFQMQAFAQATGRSVEDLLNMVQSSEEIDKALSSSNPKIRQMAVQYENIRNANEATAKAIGMSAEEQLRTKNNQELLVAISQKWHQIISQAASVLLPVVNIVLTLVLHMMQLVPIGMAFIGVVAKLFSKLESIGGVIARITGKFGILTKIFPIIARIGVFFAEWAEPIGWVILALQFIYDLAKRLYAIWSDPNMSIGKKIWEGIKAYYIALYDVLIKPFVDAFMWIVHGLGFGANSPSKLGLTIVRGLEGVGAMIFDALTYPFRMAFSWILNKIPGMSKFATKISAGAGGLLNSVESKAMDSYIPAVQITPDGISSPSTKGDIKDKNNKIDKNVKDNSDILQSILDGITRLNANLESGKLKSGDIYLDGSLVSTMLAKNLDFRGSFGTNK